MSERKEVALIVVEPEPAQAPVPPADGDDDVDLHFKPFRGKARRAERKKVDFSRLEKELNEAQGQIGGLVDSLEQKSPSGKFSLSEISLSLAVSAEGSIGIATVGAEASITLTYSKPG
jgi:hypothetical protein